MTTALVGRKAWFYYEKNHAGQWTPVVSYGDNDDDIPMRDKDGYISSINGRGPEISRPIKLPIEEFKDGPMFGQLTMKYPRPQTEKEKEDGTKG